MHLQTLMTNIRADFDPIFLLSFSFLLVRMDKYNGLNVNTQSEPMALYFTVKSFMHELHRRQKTIELLVTTLIAVQLGVTVRGLQN